MHIVRRLLVRLTCTGVAQAMSPLRRRLLALLALPWPVRARDEDAPTRAPTKWLVRDSDGSVIGTPANWQERSGNDGPTPNADLPLAPLPRAPKVAADCGAYWYNDFGLEWTRLNAKRSWMGWYDWRWNWVSTDGFVDRSGRSQGYFPDRQPTLGWYRGDDFHTLSWQTKWLVEHGCSWAVVQQRTVLPDDGGRWDQPESLAHWCWGLLRTPAVAKGLFDVCFWLPNCTSSTLSAYAPSAGTWRADDSYADGEPVRSPRDNKVYRAARSGARATPAADSDEWRSSPGDNAGQIGRWNPERKYRVGASVVDAAGDQRQYRARRENVGRQPQYASGPDADWEPVSMPDEWRDFAAFYGRYKDHVKTIRHQGKAYATVFMWEAESCRVVWGSGAFQSWLAELGQAMHDANPGWEGVAVLMRASPSPRRYGGARGSGSIDYDDALQQRVLLLRTDYPGTQASAGARPGPEGYASLIDNFKPSFRTPGLAEALDRRVYCVPTALSSLRPHEGTADFRGHSPTLFGRFLRRAISLCRDGKGFVDADGKPVVLVYNVAEWTEGGPGLQPNVQDGFGYLSALKQAVTERS